MSLTAENAAKAAAMIDDAIALIADPEHWTTGEYARDAAGEPCGPIGPGAVQRCASGALIAACHAHIANDDKITFENYTAANTVASGAAWNCLYEAVGKLGGVGVTSFNDRDPADGAQIGGHAGVLQAMRLAAASLRQQAAAGDG